MFVCFHFNHTLFCWQGLRLSKLLDFRSEEPGMDYGWSIFLLHFYRDCTIASLTISDVHLVMDSSIPGQESCQRMTGPLTEFVHKIVKS